MTLNIISGSKGSGNEIRINGIESKGNTTVTKNLNQEIEDSFITNIPFYYTDEDTTTLNNTNSPVNTLKYKKNRLNTKKNNNHNNKQTLSTKTNNNNNHYISSNFASIQIPTFEPSDSKVTEKQNSTIIIENTPEGESIRQLVKNKQSLRKIPVTNKLINRMEDALIKWKPPQSSQPQIYAVINGTHPFQDDKLPVQEHPERSNKTTYHKDSSKIKDDTSSASTINSTSTTTSSLLDIIKNTIYNHKSFSSKTNSNNSNSPNNNNANGNTIKNISGTPRAALVDSQELKELEKQYYETLKNSNSNEKNITVLKIPNYYLTASKNHTITTTKKVNSINGNLAGVFNGEIQNNINNTDNNANIGMHDFRDQWNSFWLHFWKDLKMVLSCKYEDNYY
ncbi:uncharacterized protein SCDLUD_000285 [Saccharomycodes ludwigii]|uniref:uncharacterized protein n=1 Tax=Saccharomycodes ludwigii TaxID=36035 RepID=UPI001E842E82|nr:hypothetical protein SCDLUD_000285 [Saccharomycodes ludwigii]KAH3902701.1 hypothetical protein SCDLUD_000285 [Saccharomycodes ludwigii]